MEKTHTTSISISNMDSCGWGSLSATPVTTKMCVNKPTLLPRIITNDYTIFALTNPLVYQTMNSLKKQPADILIVEDDADDRLLMDFAIEQLTLDVTVLTVPDARDALDYLQTCQRPPSLLITDLNMPYLNGIELLNLIKQSARHRVMPVVILTTSAAEEDRERCYQAGANAFLVKPNRFSEMTGLLNSCVQVWLGTVRPTS